VQEELLTHNEHFCFERVPHERLAVGVHNDPERIAHWLSRPVRHLSTDRPDIALELRNHLATDGGARLPQH
jgi:glycerophosphoryl diester phosphodiesterase